ncbi:MAG: c-type cytochrome [Kofleriaceae bacterium]
MKLGTLITVATAVVACRDSRIDPTRPQATSKAAIARGEYLAKIEGCVYCHAGVGTNGPDFSHPMSGGFEVREKFGTWRSPNITQDTRSGIGTWTDVEIAAAIREGVRPDGTQLYPVMPYLDFNRMTDADTNALVAYLRTVPAVDHVVAANELALPQLRAPKPTNAVDPVGDPVKHGEYLVRIMSCGMCHTPLGADGTPDRTKQFAGGVEIEIPKLGIGKLYSSNITSDRETGIGAWTDEQLARAIRMPGVGGGRLEQYMTGNNPMTSEDLASIAAYVKTIAPVRNVVPHSDFKALFATTFGRDRTSISSEPPLASASR